MRNSMFILWGLSCLVSCENNKKQIANHVTEDTTEIQEAIPPVQPSKTEESMLLWEEHKVKIWGDSTIDKRKIHYAEIKFEPYISFRDFRVDSLFMGEKYPIQYKSNRLAREFRTRITEDYKTEGVNFAGHYCFVVWGCGFPCQTSAIVDAKTGLVYDGLDATRGFEFRKDSKMVLVNPPDSLGFYEDHVFYRPEIWIFNEQTKKFKQINPAKD